MTSQASQAVMGFEPFALAIVAVAGLIGALLIVLIQRMDRLEDEAHKLRLELLLEELDAMTRSRRDYSALDREAFARHRALAEGIE
ncbi:hypothetical protein WG936_08095 [Corynebacterium sp. H127]|uniref:hypothetical protein n=1 Tax=Corynebacterium sp. H127 TaxID=3133418 RepID=UPI0030B1BA5A